MTNRIDITKNILSPRLTPDSPRKVIIEWLNQNVGPSIPNEDTRAEHFDDYIGVGWRFGRTTTIMEAANRIPYYATSWYVEIEDSILATLFILKWG